MRELIQSPYEILELPLNAPAEQVKKQYKLLIRKFPPEQKPTEFNQIRQAYDMLVTEFFRKKDIFPLYQSAIVQQAALGKAIRKPVIQDLLKVFETPFNTHFEIEKILDTIHYNR
jgi:curved DNA-binding protein CbpA